MVPICGHKRMVMTRLPIRSTKDMKLSESLRQLARPLRRSSQATLSSPHLPMAVVSARLVWLVSMVLVIGIWATQIGLMAFKQNTFASLYGNWALVKIPGQPSDYTEGMLKSLLTLADVMPTGYHAARCANVQKGDKVVVIGDGAVGQCAVIAAKLRGAAQIVLMSRHEDRQQMALASGATAVVAERGDEGIAKVREILGGGADAALECVGTEAAIDQALGVLHNGGRVGYVGVPHYNNRPLGSTFAQNIVVAGGSASVTTYDKQFLLKAVLDGNINPGRVFTQTYPLADINQAYQDMQNRKTIKAMITID